MTHFEYIFVAVSIILSFTLLRLLDALPFVFSRARGYWINGVWVLFLLCLAAIFWWLSWSNRNLGEISFLYFLFHLASASVLYLTATALASSAPALVSSWHEHFYLVRRRFFMGALIYISLLVANTFVTFKIPLQHPMRVAHASMIGLFAAGALLPSERAQSFLGALASALLALALVLALSGRSPSFF